MLLALLLAQALPATAPVNAPSRTERLDAALSAKDYVTVGSTLRSANRPEEVRSDLNWLKARLFEGSSAFVAMMYAQELWAMAEQLPPAAADQVRQTAAFALLHAYGATTTDGARCADVSAPQHRRDQIAALVPGLWTYVARLPAPTREKLVAAALLLDARTAARRQATGDEAFMCRDGMDEAIYNLRHGTVRERQTPRGQIGRTMITSGDGRYEPKLVNEARSAMAAARAKLPELLRRNLGLSVP